MAACDCDLDTAFRFLSERLGWASDLDLSALRPPADEAAAAAEGAAATPKAPVDELARFTAVPGLVGEIVDWIVATSRRPNRVLALGAAVTVVGNRFLTLGSNLRAVDRDLETDPSQVPAGLSHALQALYLWSGPESLIQIGNPSAKIKPDVLPWTTQEANDCYTEFTGVVEDHVDEHQGSGAYLARCAETAVRLATIRAAGRWGRGARVDLSDIEWGVGVAWTAGQALAAAAQDFLPQNERGEMTEKILAYVRRKHPLKPRDIQQFLKGRLRSKEIKDILSQLVEAGEIEWQGDEYQPTAK
jgi:hypothetical protein